MQMTHLPLKQMYRLKPEMKPASRTAPRLKKPRNPPPLDPMQLWQGIADTPALVEYFKDSFDTLGVSVEGTEHSLTVTHTGTALELKSGIAEDVDFQVTITPEQVMNMVSNAEDNQISEQESWRILNVLFTPMTAVTLDNEVLTNNRLRKALGVEDLTHVSLLNPSGDTASSHTLFYVKGQWVVVSGLHGKPRRTYTLTPAQALEYQKKIFSPKADDRKQWKEWAKWYVNPGAMVCRSLTPNKRSNQDLVR